MKHTAAKILAGAVLAATAHGKPESMEAMKLLKQQTWDAQRAAGAFDIDRYSRQAATRCTDGKAGEYSCDNVDLVSFLRHQDMGSSTRQGNDIWGKFQVSHQRSNEYGLGPETFVY